MKRVIVTFTCCLMIYFAQAQSPYEQAQTQARSDAERLHCHPDDKRSVYIDNHNILHVFIYEDGNYLLHGFPTSATEKERFIVHLYKQKENKDNYTLEAAGSYEPMLNIGSANELAVTEKSQRIQRFDFAVFGPFTGTVRFTLRRTNKEGVSTIISAPSVIISKTIYASIGSGLIYSSLRNPRNIRKSQTGVNVGDSTLLADDPTGRGILMLCATYYPKGRNNLMMRSEKFADHIGFLVGTSIVSSATSFNDFFLGAQYDFLVGGALICGLHYGYRQRIHGVDYKSFHFGETKFSGDLSSSLYKKWDLGIFFGLQMDSRIFSQLFK